MQTLEKLETQAAVIEFRRGTPGELAAAAFATAASTARRRLAGFGSEPTGLRPIFRLVDPFPDPDQPDSLIEEGTLIDTAGRVIWMVVSESVQPEAPERPLALLFGAAFPAADRLGGLIEGYGLHVARTPDTNAMLTMETLVPLADSEGERRSAMHVSFVRFLIDRFGERELLRFLKEADSDNVTAAAEQIFGANLSMLEEAWQRSLTGEGDGAPASSFFRLSMKFARRYWLREAEIFFWALASLSFTIGFPYVSRKLFDKAIPSGSMDKVWSSLGWLSVLLVVSMAATLRRSYLSSAVTSRVVQDLRIDMFTKLQTLDERWYNGREQGDVMTRLISDVRTLEAGISAIVREGLFQFMSLVVAAVVMLQLNWKLGLVGLATVPTLLVTFRLLAGGAQRRSLQVEQETGALATVAVESYLAREVVRSYGLAGREVSRFANVSKRLVGREVSLNKYLGIFRLLIEIVIEVVRVAILGFGAWMILRGEISLGTLVGFLSLLGQVVSPVNMLSEIGQSVQQSLGSLERIKIGRAHV